MRGSEREYIVLEHRKYEVKSTHHLDLYNVTFI